MIDINLIRTNKELVKENIKKKFQDHKLPLVDEVVELDKQVRALKQEGDDLRAMRKTLSNQVGALMKEKRIEEANEVKAKVVANNERITNIEAQVEVIEKQILQKMMTIPNIVDESVPVGRDDSENVEVQRFGEAKVPAYEIPYNADILQSFDGLDKESAGRTSGNGFYYLMGDAARLVTAMISYARDYMIDKNFIYAIPPFMIRSDVVTGVMSFAEMDAMMYKIEGEDLYLIGTSEHSMIGKFKDQIMKETELPITMTSYSPCFRKEVGAHGIEERGIYKIGRAHV